MKKRSSPLSELFRSDVADGGDHDSLDGVHTVLGLVEHLGVRGEEHLVGDLADIVAELHLALGHGGVEVVEGGRQCRKMQSLFSVAFITSPVTL